MLSPRKVPDGIDDLTHFKIPSNSSSIVEGRAFTQPDAPSKKLTSGCAPIEAHGRTR
jgi:hypothetical protein